MQSPRCRKLFSFTCKNEFTLCLTLKLFLPVLEGMLFCWSNLFAKIYLFYDTWMPTLLPNTDIYYTFCPITHKLLGPIFSGLPPGNPLSLAYNSFSCCWLFLSVNILPNPLDGNIWPPESLLLIIDDSLRLTWIPKLKVSFFLALSKELIVS